MDRRSNVRMNEGKKLSSRAQVSKLKIGQYVNETPAFLSGCISRSAVGGRRSAVGGRRSVSRRSVSRRQPRGRRDRPRQILNDLRLHFFIPVPRSFSSADDDSSMAANGIQYSERYYDDVYEYRHVVLPPEITKKVGTVELARHAQTRSLTRSLVRLSARPLVRFSRCQRGG